MVDKTPEENDVPKDEKFDKDGNLFIKLTVDDSALVVRADGGIEMISHELEKAEGGYVGDIEDLNKTFSLVAPSFTIGKISFGSVPKFYIRFLLQFLPLYSN